MGEFETLIHPTPAEHIARIVLNRPDTRNAQDTRRLYEFAKESLNAAQDAQGRLSAMRTSFALHQLAHNHNMQLHGMLIDPTGLAPALRKRSE